MKLYTDHYFHIGFAHLGGGKPCQDYAISQVYKNAAITVVSDGCSTGGDTDVGSRIIALTTMAAMRDHRDLNRETCIMETPFEVAVRQEIVLAGAQKILNLSTKDMLATCIYAYITPTGGFIHIKGDGAFAVKLRNGRIIMSKFEWMGNMPYYPAYKNGSLDGFIQAHGNELDVVRLVEEVWQKDHEGEMVMASLNEYALSDGIQGISFNISEQMLKEELEFIAIFSDGIAQIDGVDWREAILEFTNFKSVKGEFAKRRMIRGIKLAETKGKGPLDDISYAVIRIGNETEE